MQVKIADETKAKLIQLAGGKNKIGIYLDRIVEEIYDVEMKENERDAAIAKEIREAIARGERETVPLAQVEAELRAKGLLSV